MGTKLVNTREVWRSMVYDYHINFAAAVQIILMLQNGLTQDQIEAELPKGDAWCYARYSFNNRVQFEEA